MIKINIKDKDGHIYNCKPFDYDAYEGETFEKVIPIPVNGNTLDEHFHRNEIRIFLKMFPKVAIDRPPVAISKNRRVIEMYMIKSLRTFNKRDLWNNPSITGYIDTKDLLNPTLARNDFRNDKNYRLVKKAILETEPEILEKFKKASERINSGDFSEIESKFNSNFKSLIEVSEEEQKELKPGDFVKVSDNGTRLADVLIPNEHGPTVSEYKSLSTEKKSKKKNDKNTIEESEKVMVEMEPTREFIIPPKVNQRNLLLKIDDTSEPIKDNEGKEKRSELFGNTVTIYKKHPDFAKRINKKSSWSGAYLNRTRHLYSQRNACTFYKL